MDGLIVAPAATISMQTAMAKPVIVGPVVSSKYPPINDPSGIAPYASRLIALATLPSILSGVILSL
jgi:hypothetical protein